jgi:UDP-N-acetylglucosamine 2-epimerase (non-hydrolysing)
VKKVAVLMGTRPEAIKLAPVVHALKAHADLAPIAISTGQHKEMLHQVVDLFGITLDHDLAVMQPDQTLATLTARLTTAIDSVLAQTKPDMVVVQGDTTTAFVGALVGFYRGIPVGHVEAGLRTGNLQAPFPEEANRRLVSVVARYHYAPTTMAAANLRREGVSEDAILITGNTVIDALMLELQRQSAPAINATITQELDRQLGTGWNRLPYVVVTGHRRENFGAGFDQICDALESLAARFRDHLFIYPVHLNPKVKLVVERRLGAVPNIRLLTPLDYSTFAALLKGCRLVLTDSGGIQEEAPALGKPVLVMRDVTERPEGIQAGTVALVGTDRDKIVDQVTHLLTDSAAYARMAQARNPYGDGKAAPRIVSHLRGVLGLTSESMPAPVPEGALRV